MEQNKKKLWRIKLSWEVRTTGTQRVFDLTGGYEIGYQFALMGAILYARDNVAVEKLRVWELR